MNDAKNVFITDDITLETIPFYGNDVEAYEYTEDMPAFLEYVQDDSEEATEDEKATAKSFSETFPASLGDVRDWIESETHNRLYDEWCDRADERYIEPMMNAVRWFPSFVSFTEADRYKCSGSTCLIYDTEGERWGVGMSGGGMDLSPHLLATFVNLGKGVPSELASSIRRDYSAYVETATHEANCDLLAYAYEGQGLYDLDRAIRLRKEDDERNATIKRHVEGLRKTRE